MGSSPALRMVVAAGAIGLALSLATGLGATTGAALGASSPAVQPKSTTAGLLIGMKVSKLAGNRPSRGGATLTPQAAGALDGRVIVVDPGHNGVYRKAINRRSVAAGRGKLKACNSSGTSTNAGFAEHRFNWLVAVQLVGDLRARGATVVLTRPDDAGIGPCVNERAAIGNRARADLVVSIHADGSYRRGARGFHLIVSPAMVAGARVEARSLALAGKLRARIPARTGMPRSTYIGHKTGLSVRSDIAGLNLSKVPAVMLEAGNMRNSSDAKLLASAGFRAKLAKALADGVQAQLA